MRWGIIFTTTIKVNRLYIRDKIELQEKIKETEALIKDLYILDDCKDDIDWNKINT